MCRKTNKPETLLLNGPFCDKPVNVSQTVVFLGVFVLCLILVFCPINLFMVGLICLFVFRLFVCLFLFSLFSSVTYQVCRGNHKGFVHRKWLQMTNEILKLVLNKVCQRRAVFFLWMHWTHLVCQRPVLSLGVFHQHT